MDHIKAEEKGGYETGLNSIVRDFIVRLELTTDQSINHTYGNMIQQSTMKVLFYKLIDIKQ